MMNYVNVVFEPYVSLKNLEMIFKIDEYISYQKLPAPINVFSKYAPIRLPCLG